MSDWRSEFKQGWKEAGEQHRRLLPWVILAMVILTLLDGLSGWRLF